MAGTLAIIDARISSPATRQRMCRRLGGHSLLELVVRRVTECQQIAAATVLFGDEQDDELAALVPPDVSVYRHPSPDMLARVAGAIECYEADAVVRVRAEQPFVDPAFIDRLATTAAEHPECDYVGYRSRSARSALVAPLGLFAEWCRASAIHEAATLARADIDRHDWTRYVVAHPERFQLRLIPLPAGVEEAGLRLSMHDDGNWENALAMYDALGHDFEWRRAVELCASSGAED